MSGSADVNDAEFKVDPIAGPQAAAIRADFLAYNQRSDDAKALLDQVLKDDPQSLQARETLGYIAFHEGKHAEARKWFAEAVKLDSQSYLANYYYGAMSMNGQLTEDEQRSVETSLRTAIRLNPSFAPAYDRLAVFLAMTHKDLNEAHVNALHAVQTDPSNVIYRLNAANVLMQMQQADNAVRVLQAASVVAKDEGERAMVQNALEMAQRFQQMQAQIKARNDAIAAENANVNVSEKRSLDDNGRPLLARSVEDKPATPAVSKAVELPLTGPRKTMTGKIGAVECSMPAALDLKLVEGSRTLHLHAANYYKVAFSALGYTPTGELHPCTDIQGMNAKVEYVETSDKVLHITAVELHK
jgi:tetratricopeptide (TPR) repeat protein